MYILNAWTMIEEVHKASKLINSGGIILYPTDTIWGIGCDATNQKAVQKILNLKGREQTKSMIILLDDVDKLMDYIKKVPPIAYDLIANSVSPLTIVYPGAKKIHVKEI